MFEGFKEFKAILNGNNIRMKNGKFAKTIRSFNFEQIINNENDTQFFHKIEQSKFIIIDACSLKNDEKYIISCFDRQLIIIKSNIIQVISALFSEKNIDKINFVPKKQPDWLNELTKSFHLNENSVEKNELEIEVDSLIQSIQIHRESDQSIKSFWKTVSPCISTYLILQNYINNGNNRFCDFYENIAKTKDTENFNEDDFIFLKTIHINSTARIDLGYHIKSEKIFAIKRFLIEDDETKKLFQREFDNYNAIKYPLLPKLYGKFINRDGFFLVIEFIKGNTLLSLEKKLKNNIISFEEKLMIIIEILFTFQYLHRINFVYRDLKLDNLIIDQNKHAILIDFDRMVKKGIEYEYTGDFGTNFLAPEFNKPIFESDIYSIGKMIFYIITGERQNNVNNEFQKQYPSVYKIAEKCCHKNPKERPSLIDLIEFFDTLILNFHNSLLIRNIEKNISLLIIAEFYSLVIEENDIDAQSFLCFIYYEKKYITQDVN